MRLVLLTMDYEQTVTVGLRHVTRLDLDLWCIEGELLDLEFSLYAVGA